MGSTNDDGNLRRVGGIHVYSTESNGEMAYGRLRNSMHRIWKEIDPGSMSDVCDLVVRDLTDARREVLGG